MNANEAWDSMMNGKKIRRTYWRDDDYIYFDKGEYKVKNKYGKETPFYVFDEDTWELYEEEKEGNFMNFEEAKKALLEGKKVRCTDWAKDAYVYFDEKNMLVKDCFSGTQVYNIYHKWGKRKWELYEETKKIIKVFISQPMKRRSKCEITEERNKIKTVIEAKYGEEYVIEYLNEDVDLWGRPEEWTRIQHLGYSIMNMHDADIVVFAPDWIKASGCCVEHEVAYRYDKKIHTCEEEVDGEYLLY